MNASTQPLAVECVHVETVNGHLGFPGRTRIAESRDCIMLSGALNRLRKQRRLSFAELDRLAVRACGRKWCDFTGVGDYQKAIRAVAGV